MPFDPALLAFGAGVLGSNTPSPVPLGFGQTFARSMMGGLGAYNQMRGQMRDDRLGQLKELALIKELSKQDANELQLVGDPSSGLGVFDKRSGTYKDIKPGNEPAKTRTVKRNGVEVTEEYDRGTMKWNPIGESPIWDPNRDRPNDYQRWLMSQPRSAGNAPESYSPLSAEEAAQLGLPPGTVAQRNSRGKIDILSKPGSGMTVYGPDGQPIVTTGGGASMGKAPTGYRWRGDGSLEPIPGGPGEKSPAEAMGRLSMLPGALEDVATARKAFLGEDGKASFPESNIEAARTNVPGSSLPVLGRVIPDSVAGGGDNRSRLMGAIDTLIRMRTGAAATESEMATLSGIYMPSATDTPATIQSKLDRLQRDLDNAAGEMQRGTGQRDNLPSTTVAPPGQKVETPPDNQIAPPQTAPQAKAPGPPMPQQPRGEATAAGAGDLPAPATEAEFARLPSGTRFKAPDGSIRVKP